MAKIALMKVWDVELGLAIHIKAPNGRYIVIDLGSKAGVSPIKSLWGQDVGHMIITHPHYDHFSDVQNIGSARPCTLCRCHSYTREELLRDAQSNQRDTFIPYCDFVESYNQLLEEKDNPESKTPFNGLTAKSFSTTTCDKTNKNNFSSIVALKLGNAKIIVCGDNEEASLKELMKEQSFKDSVNNAYILVAPHHGRASGYYSDFVSLVHPFLTIISDTSRGETSVTDKYENYCKGYSVHNLNTNKKETRKCLSTRQDGNIEVGFGEPDDPQYNGTLYVNIHA